MTPGRSLSGAVFPNAVLDLGVLLIPAALTTLNVIYGAIGILWRRHMYVSSALSLNDFSPSLIPSTQTTYLTCRKYFNLTIVFGNHTQTLIRPPGLTAEQHDPSSEQLCVRLSQLAGGVLVAANNGVRSRGPRCAVLTPRRQ